MTDPVAVNRAQMPSGTERLLDTRSLESSNRRLAELLRPGMTVLDVGCGSGAITEGIARAVGPTGRVVGIDVSQELIEHARSRTERHPNLSFEIADISSLTVDERRFDIVTAARVLQWLADPFAALHAMVGATTPGGSLVVLDYNHHKIRWEPAPPRSVLEFYGAFLEWRAQAGMDNEMADHLAGMFIKLGLRDVICAPQLEVTRRGEDDFNVRIALWGQVIATRGHQLVRDGFLDESVRAIAEADFQDWANSRAQSQTLWLASTEGVLPP